MSQDPWGFYGNMVAQNNAMMSKGAENLMEGVTSGIGSIAGAYADKSAMKAKAQSYAKIGDILGDTMFSENPNAMNALSELKKSKNPYEAVMGYEALFNMAGPMSNAMMAGRNAGIREQGQQIDRDRPFIDATLKNLGNTAAGNVPHGGGMAPVEPPLPPMSQAGPVDQAPSAAAPQVPGMPGGQASRDLLNRDRAKRGLPPI